MQHDFFFIISEINIIKDDITCQFGIGNGAVLVRMLPRPHSGSALGFCQLIAVIFSIYKGYISLIGFRLFVHHFKYSLSTSKCHNKGINLLGNLSDRSCKASAQLQERCDNTKGQATYIIDSQRSTEHCDKHILDVAKISHNRHKNIHKLISLRRIPTKLLIKLIKAFLSLILITKDLNHLLSVYHFFDIAVYLTQRLLLLYKILTAS